MSDAEHLRVQTGLDVGVDLPVASVGSRSAAYIFDMLVLLLLWLIVASVLALMYPGRLPSPQVLGLFAAGWFFSQFLLFGVQEAIRDGQTMGKRVMGIRVVGADGGPPTAGAALLRNLLRPVDNLPYGFALGTVLVGASKAGRRLGDLAAGTRVVHDLPEPRPAPRMRLPNDATAGEVALLESWASRSTILDPAAREALAARMVGWMDHRWPDWLPDGPTPLARLARGLVPPTDS